MANANVLNLTTATWEAEVTKSDKPVLVDFWASWCAPCRALGPTIDKVADQYAGKVKVAKLNVDESPDIAVKYGISGIPQVLLFNGGDKPVDKTSGVQDVAYFVKMLAKVLDK